MNPYPKAQGEALLTRAIMDIFSAAGCMVWKQSVIGVRGRKTGRRGMADIGGICPGGRALQIEVKMLGARTAPQRRSEQRAWAFAVEQHKGLLLTVRHTGEALRVVAQAQDRLGWWGVPCSSPEPQRDTERVAHYKNRGPKPKPRASEF